jgi:hypothetical protein
MRWSPIWPSQWESDCQWAALADVFSHRHWDGDYLAGLCNSLRGWQVFAAGRVAEVERLTDIPASLERSSYRQAQLNVAAVADPVNATLLRSAIGALWAWCEPVPSQFRSDRRQDVGMPSDGTRVLRSRNLALVRPR